MTEFSFLKLYIGLSRAKDKFMGKNAGQTLNYNCNVTPVFYKRVN